MSGKTLPNIAAMNVPKIAGVESGVRPKYPCPAAVVTTAPIATPPRMCVR